MNLNFLRGPGNASLDLARLLGCSAGVIYPFPFIWNVIAHGVIPDPASFGTGYAAVLASIGAMIGAKDICVAKANATSA
jgi:hypothetical protein